MKSHKDKVDGINKEDSVVIEPFVANVHNIMYWIAIVLHYNPNIPDICKKKKEV